ncbi:MAG TPA: SpoIIE family protein phosphatase [Bacteroidia bacterium]|nr:SpoIIE family protein phosphatase [Bacteroidia bacterium]
MTYTISNKNSFQKYNHFLKTITNKLFQTEAIRDIYEFEKSIILKEEIKNKKSTELNDSIIYAKRIQEGMMLKEKHLFRLFPESFILFKPKDIVSGDFYWFTKMENKIIIAVVDCTGHGIPGAFMSVLGISLLNQIIIEEKNTDVSYILQRLDHKLKKAFDYSNDFIDENKRPFDGMDISLCCIDNETNFLTYAGALRPLYHISKNDFMSLDGSRYPIGGMNLESIRKYDSQSMNFHKGDKLYLCSDGYADQFGGAFDKKFMTKKFKALLLKTSKLSMQTQQLELERLFNEWKNNEEQTDDVLVVGIQL